MRYNNNNQQTIGLPECTKFNDCKFAITLIMKFDMSKLPKTFTKLQKKSLNAKKLPKKIKFNRE